MSRAAFRLLPLLLLLAGCASTEPVQVSHDTDRGLTTYETPRSLMGYRDMSGGLAGSQRVLWQALAVCPGAGCSPAEVVLVFYNDSNYELNLDTRRLQIVYDGVTYGWEPPNQTHAPDSYGVPRGEFFRVGLPAADFAAMASAQSVRVVFGMSGSGAFPVSYDRRAGLRALAEQTGLKTSDE